MFQVLNFNLNRIDINVKSLFYASLIYIYEQFEIKHEKMPRKKKRGEGEKFET